MQCHVESQDFSLQPVGLNVSTSTVGVPAPPVEDTLEAPKDGPKGGRWVSLNISKGNAPMNF